MRPQENHAQPEESQGMQIHLDRGRRIRSFIGFWLLYIAVAGLLALLLMRFTGSKLIAFCLAGGLLLYMLIMSAVAGRNLNRSIDDGRLD